jgi:hypothetical protein
MQGKHSHPEVVSSAGLEHIEAQQPLTLWRWRTGVIRRLKRHQGINSQTGEQRIGVVSRLETH